MDPPYEKTVSAKLKGIFGPLGPAGQGGYVRTIDGEVTYEDYAARGYSPWSFKSKEYDRIFTNEDTYYDYTSGNKKYELIQSGGKSRRNRKGKKSKKRKSRKSRKTMRRRR